MRIIGLFIGSVIGLLLIAVPTALLIMTAAVVVKLFITLFGVTAMLATFAAICIAVVVAALIGVALDS